MKMKTVYSIFIIALICISSRVWAQSSEMGGLGNCNSENPENLGQHIIDYVLCGASFTNPQSTLFGAISLILNVLCLAVSLYMIVWNGFKFALFTMQKGIPGGDKVQGGIVILRSALLITMLTPIVGNGFSPSQVMMRQFGEVGASWGDSSSLAGATFISTEGAISNIDIKGTEEVSNQIIASILCSKQFEIFESLKTNPGTRGKIEIVKRQGTMGLGNTIYVSWAYKASDADTNFFGYKRDITDACGTLKFTAHDYIFDQMKLSGSGNELTFSTLTENQQPYAESASNQYAALMQHIEEIQQILEPIADDLKTVSQASALRTQLNSEDQASVESLYSNSESARTNIINQMPTVIASLAQSSNDYRDAIIDAGRNAASIVNATDSAESLDDCKPEQLLCKGAESWVTQLERQGFAATALYYVVMLQINQRILAVQKHYAVADLTVPLYESDFNHSIVKHMQSSETHAIFGERTNAIIVNFNKLRGDKSFSTDFSALKNSANTDVELEQDTILGSANKALNGFTARIHTFVSEWLSEQTESGDIVLTLMNIGSVLMSIAEYLLLLMLGGGLVWKILSQFGIAAKIIGFFGNIRNESTGGRRVLGKDSKDDSDDDNSSIGSYIGYAWLFCVFFGGILLYGLPFIIVLKWILELQSWAIMMFMAFIYAPMWIMAHASITDERFMAEHTMSGYGMILELMLRPTLLVLSFYAVLIIMRIANIGFTMASAFLASIAANSTFGLIGLVIVLALAIVAGLQLVFRTFDLVTMLTDNILQRISFGTKPLGDMDRDNSQRTFMAFLGSRAAGYGSKLKDNTVTSVARGLGLTSDSMSSAIKKS